MYSFHPYHHHGDQVWGETEGKETEENIDIPGGKVRHFKVVKIIIKN